MSLQVSHNYFKYLVQNQFICIPNFLTINNFSTSQCDSTLMNAIKKSFLRKQKKTEKANNSFFFFEERQTILMFMCNSVMQSPK